MSRVDHLSWPEGVGVGVAPLVAGADLLPAATMRTLPRHEVRVRTCLTTWPRGDLLIDASPIVGLATDGALATFTYGSEEHALIAPLDDGRLAVAISDDSPAWDDGHFLQLVAVASRESSVDRSDFGVGLLGYGAIGAEHARAILSTPGLALAAVCDPKPERIAAARELAPDVRAHHTADDLLNDPLVDIVIISTPPDSHAHWALRTLEQGRHVILEKPMALTTRECDEILAAAADRNLLAAVYQNRRFDPDFRLIVESVRAGQIGEAFHLEAFVGGYGHPCNYWHSDAQVSGGALFDWGSHVIDQVLALFDGEVESVTALNHKRVWHDTTNADHARMTLHFDGGREATFIYSDLAAALKPRWYVLGTRGAITGDWRQESVIARSAIGTLDEDILAAADSPPIMRRHSPDGDLTTLVARPAEPHPFHADMALRLRYGFAPRVRGIESRRVVAMLEAAEESARLGGLPVKPA
ncbi:MAG: Gfo/Idh/MocA family protein [Actinomycetota bacterium]